MPIHWLSDDPATYDERDFLPPSRKVRRGVDRDLALVRAALQIFVMALALGCVWYLCDYAALTRAGLTR